MKYIDAEKLNAEIERRLAAYKKNFDQADDKMERLSIDGRIASLKELLPFIVSLQQEQQKPNLENEIKDYTEALYHETFGNGQGTLDEFDWEDIV